MSAHGVKAPGEREPMRDSRAVQDSRVMRDLHANEENQTSIEDNSISTTRTPSTYDSRIRDPSTHVPRDRPSNLD